MLRRISGPALAFDIGVSALFALAAFVADANNGYGDLVGYALAWIIPAIMGTATAFWRLSPAIALVLAWAGALLEVVGGRGPELADAAIPVVLFATAAWGSRTVRWVGFGSAFAGALVAAVTLASRGVLSFAGVDERVPRILSFGGSVVLTFVVIAVFLLFAWTLGLLVSLVLAARDRARAATRARQEIAAEQERTRIARDMHDVVAHSLAVVVAQADGARYAGRTDPTTMETALATISTTAREALSDVRVLLGQLRHSQGDAPQPTLGDLDRLVDSLRSSGLRVREEVTGDPVELGTGSQLAAYRIVQESLTNALRHGDPEGTVDLRLGWRADGLALRVANRMPERPVRGIPGHGLAGMTERAALVGGRLEAGERDGDFVVEAWLPAHPVARPAGGAA